MPAVRVGEALGVELGGAGQHARGSAAGRRPRPARWSRPWRAGRPISAQRVVVAHGDPVDVGHRQGEAGALQQAGGVVGVGEGRDARAGAAAAAPARPSVSACAQLGQGRAAEDRAEEEAVGLQRLADLDQGADAGRWSSAGRARRPPGRGSRARTAAAPRRRRRRGPGAAGQHGRARGRSRSAAPTLAAASLAASAAANAPSRAPRSTATGKSRADRLQALDEVLGGAAP